MPFTPFHFGPGAAIHAVAPRHISFLAFCAANVLIDVEPLYFMVTGQYPLHRFFHTYIGASLMAAATVALFLLMRWIASRLWLPNLFGWQQLKVLPVALGAFLGTYSHILLDSVMHRDITPLAPFSDANPLFRVVPLDVLHWSCVLLGLVAACVIAWRWLAGEHKS
jgi:membrane-bound metal-dependent hydrolase YbcI (DUF457 family)